MDRINPRRSPTALAVLAAICFIATLRLGALVHPFASQTWPTLWFHVGVQIAAIGVILVLARLCRAKIRWVGHWDSSLWFCITTVALSLSTVAIVVSVEGWTVATRVAVGWVVTSIFVGIGEELTFRGVGLGAMIEERGVAAAVGLSALIFGLAHLSNLAAGQGFVATRSQVIFAATAGLLFGWTYVRTRGSLWAVAGTHCLYDLGLFLLSAEKPNSMWVILGIIPALFAIASGIILQVHGIDHAAVLEKAWITSGQSDRTAAFNTGAAGVATAHDEAVVLELKGD